MGKNGWVAGAAMLLCSAVDAMPGYSDVRGVDTDGKNVPLVDKRTELLCVRAGQRIRVRACRGHKESLVCCKPTAFGCPHEWTYSDLVHLVRWDSHAPTDNPVFRIQGDYVELAIPAALQGVGQIKVGYWSSYDRQRSYLVSTRPSKEMSCTSSEAITVTDP